ncbi:MAG: aldo/keto reductase [Chloroflexi bacterium]|nr:aldo/keto reductase [Chloroflexota bacterium]
MITKTLGNSDTRVSAIGQGMGLGGYSSSSGTYGDLIPVIRAGVDAGLTFIDTAPAYGEGESERIVGRAIGPIRNNVTLGTKVSPADTTADGVVRSAEDSLGRLRTDVIDLFQIHWSNPTVPIEDTMAGMERLIQQGKIRHVGVSNYSVNELKAARQALASVPIASLQVEYNLFDRSIEDTMLPYCIENDITVFAYSPLHRGRVTSGKRQIETLERIAADHDCTTAQVALSWLVSQRSVVAIPNTSRQERVLENAAAGELHLSEVEQDEISRVCSLQQQEIPTDQIRPASEDSRAAFRTLQEALDNTIGSTPSPRQLAEQIKAGDFLKPVRLMPVPGVENEYEVLEGRLRYWAWVIAFDGKKPITALVDDPS